MTLLRDFFNSKDTVDIKVDDIYTYTLRNANKYSSHLIEKYGEATKLKPGSILNL